MNCRWEYKGVPCEVKGVVLHDNEHGKSEVAGLIVNTGIGPDIEAMLEDLAYEPAVS